MGAVTFIIMGDDAEEEPQEPQEPEKSALEKALEEVEDKWAPQLSKKKAYLVDKEKELAKLSTEFQMALEPLKGLEAKASSKDLVEVGEKISALQSKVVTQRDFYIGVIEGVKLELAELEYKKGVEAEETEARIKKEEAGEEEE